jgi:outer membrane protein assembly factor BamA
MKHFLSALLLLSGQSLHLAAQEPTRTATIEASRTARAENPPVSTPDRLEVAVDRIKSSGFIHQIITGVAGFGFRFGGLPTGGGFALGPAYSKPALWNEHARFKVSAAGSLSRYYGIDANLSFPRLLNRRMRLDLYASRNDAPTIPYYGPGPKSNREGRTNFRREDTVFASLIGARLHPRHVTAGFTTGVQMVNVGPGTSKVFASTDSVFSPQQTPGIREQSDFFHAGPFVQVDFRDRRDDPHKGFNLVSRYTFNNDKLDRYSFRRFENVAEGYIPFRNEKRVIAVRARMDLSYTSAGHQVPFYMQPVLGGSDDLRGFREFRFYDNNALLLNAEYRWEVAPALDMALFVDAGNVFSRPGDIGLSGLEKSGGFGLRFKNRDAVVVRVDTGFSREGFRIWFKFGQPFTGLFHNLF